MQNEAKIEHVAAALYTHRYADPHLSTNGRVEPWDQFKERKPDIAAIYRDNAMVAIEAIAEHS